MYFEPLRNMAKAATDLKTKELLRLLFSDNDIQELVIELNTENQLFEKGVDSTGKSLASIGGGYTDVTISIKRTEGQPFEWVTLKDTGDFYESFEVRPQSDGVLISANTLKNGKDLQIRWGTDIVGLTDESKQELIFNLIPLLQSEIKKRLLH